MAEQNPDSKGVQDLIVRIRDEGVQAAREEAARILAEAQRQAARQAARARAEVEEMRQKARAELEAEKTAALEALKLAARDTGLELEAAVIQAFQNWVKRLVSPVTRNEEMLRALVLVLAGRAVEEFIQDKDIRIFVSDVLAREPPETPELKDRVTREVLGISGEMLREGVELVPSRDVQGGARVRLVGENLEIDLTEDEVHKVLMRHLLPRFREILEGVK